MTWETWHPHPTIPGVGQRYFLGEGETFHRQTVEDVEPILKRNAAGRTGDGFSADRSRRHVATIPATVFYDWIAEWQREGRIAPGHMSGLNDLIRERLRDRDWRKLRASRGGI